MRRLALLLLALAAVCLLVPQAVACDSCGGCGGGYGGYGLGFGMGLLYRNLDYNIPYYAAYPPVYYSQPVARPYGYSPFAYPPGVRTPQIVVEPVEPATIINPHTEQPASNASNDAAEEKMTSTRQAKPLVILNPFVQQRFRHVSN